MIYCNKGNIAVRGDVAEIIADISVVTEAALDRMDSSEQDILKQSLLYTLLGIHPAGKLRSDTPKKVNLGNAEKVADSLVDILRSIDI